ncbi:two-component system chemotaxis sensor kinase CheA [Bacillus tianshenii]|uniref:Chemotaxis protein CheA n=1 Tax=Sutcliffiella tianshenii TaxID=1463404 RepID=A0ABS2NWH0_9BACI|nr:chemotaxis protein CheA [Bacillus tianshenii]MBM7619008.1 two-component system chemotaxis sensor kinase CheA [Bacillus tianshenii]
MELSQYLDIFLEESKEHLETINNQLVELERNPQSIEIVNEIFRSAHTLKGMSATMGYEDLASLTHQMENVLDMIRNHKLSVSSNLLDVIFRSVEYLEEMVFSIADGGDGKKDVSDVVALLVKIEKGEMIETVSNSASGSEEEHEYDSYELTILQQSEEQGYLPLEVKVTLRKDCLLKAARVFMVFEVVEQIGEVIKSTPPVEQLEEENFDDSFVVTMVTKENQEDVIERIMKVSEVEKVEINIIHTKNLSVMEKKDTPIEPDADKDEFAPSITEVAAAVEPAAKTPDTPTATKAGQTNKTIRVSIDRLDGLMNLFEELVIDRGRLEQISKELNEAELIETVERMSRISNDLQNIILNMRMVPIETVFNRFPRMVRQLARDLGKKVEIEIIGAETELDRTVMDEIGDPLVHLLRNAIDHGIEMPDKRRSAGKDEEGKITLKAFHSGNHVFIEIVDNGGGISRQKVLNKAISRGIVAKQAADSLTDQEVFQLILSSGFSTAEVISDISGRGVGLDVVKNTIESLGGNITIDSTEGKGTTFSIQLPLTLSIISVLLTEVEKEKYAIPLSSIIETAIIKKEEILTAHGQEVIDFRGKIVPIVHLEKVFHVKKEDCMQADLYSIVLVKKGEKMAALVVDSFIGQQEVVLKALGQYLSTTYAISGATILGDGQVALIVDCNALIK